LQSFNLITTNQNTSSSSGDHSNLTSCPTSPEFVNITWNPPKCDFATALQKLVQDDLQMQHEISLYSQQSDYQFANNSYGLGDMTENFLSSWNDTDNIQSLLL